MISYKSIISISVFIMMTNIIFPQDKRLEKADSDFNSYAYVDAREIYLEVAESGYSSSSLFKKLADSYYFNAELENAVIWYERLIDEYADDIDPEYFFRYSQCLKSVKRYDQSDEMMEKFNAITGNDQRAEIFMNTRDYLDFIELQSGRFDISELDINSNFSDYAPSFNHKGNLIFASSRAGNNMSKTIHEWNKMPFLDLFSSEIIKEDEILSAPKKIKGKINTRFHESSTTFSKDGNTVYFTRNNYIKKKLATDTEGTILLKLYKATFREGKWNDIEELPFNSNEYSVAHPTLSADGKKLYFASDMPGSMGLSDVFVVDVYDNGTFGEPKSLGDRINTEGRETFPYISDSGNLYFASDGHIGLGGLDIFVAVPKYNTFSDPYNVGKPINGPEDDFSFVLNEDSNTGYFASNRSGGKGSDDIYYLKQKEELIVSCEQYISGLVTDIYTEEIIVNGEVILLDVHNNEITRTFTDYKGEYKLKLDCKTTYVVRAAKEGYGTAETIYSTNDALQHEENLPFQIGKGGLGKKAIKEGDDLANILELQTIYFNSNKFDIRPDAEVELQKIIAVLKEYPKMKIDVRSHTDSRASASYNRWLSGKRAEKTMLYIVNKGGIDAFRITGKGYGESVLINECADGIPCSIPKHQLNRRSEFIILK